LIFFWSRTADSSNVLERSTEANRIDVKTFVDLPRSGISLYVATNNARSSDFIGLATRGRRQQRALDACQAAAHGFRELDHVWIIGRALYRPFAERSHAQSAFDGEL